MRPRIPALAALAVLCACSVEQAPADLDGLSRWFWVNYEAAADEDVAGAFANLDAALAGLELPIDGTVERLAKDDVAHVELSQANDPAATTGFVVVTSIPCTLAKLEPLVYALNQDELHPDTYDRYARRHTSDRAAYEARATSTLAWSSDIAASPLGYSYEETVRGGARWVAAESGGSKFGPLLLSRTWLPAPAKFEDPDSHFRQDYQIEAFYERAPGEVVHLFAVWREMKVGSFDLRDSGNFQRIQVDNFVKWDESLGALCAK